MGDNGLADMAGYGSREMVPGDLYGDAVPVMTLEFVPNDGHGQTHAERSRALWPDNPAKHSALNHTRCFDVSGPHGNLHGYIDAGAFKTAAKRKGWTDRACDVTETVPGHFREAAPSRQISARDRTLRARVRRRRSRHG